VEITLFLKTSPPYPLSKWSFWFPTYVGMVKGERQPIWRGGLDSEEGLALLLNTPKERNCFPLPETLHCVQGDTVVLLLLPGWGKI